MNSNPLCASMQTSFSAYLDGDISGLAMQQIAEHLDACPDCAHEFAAWRAVQDSLAVLRNTRAQAPRDLGLKLRIAISHENSRRTSSIFDSLALRWENTLRPFALQIAAGFVVAVALLGGLTFLLGTVAAPQAVLANDEPLGAMTPPHYLYSAEHPRPIVTGQDSTIVVDALINDRGRVYDYSIVSGPVDPAVQPQIANQLLLSVFAPASVFGAPVRGRVILTYAGVSVRN
jgi:anti-sigma factor RsiW